MLRKEHMHVLLLNAATSKELLIEAHLVWMTNMHDLLDRLHSMQAAGTQKTCANASRTLKAHGLLVLL